MTENATVRPGPKRKNEGERVMQIYRSGSQPINRAPESSFTGDVLIGGYFHRAGPSRLSGATVEFSPGSRTPWKLNPAGQTLIVTNGVGWAQVEGEEVTEIRSGDILWCPPGQRHWEGATSTQSMTYVAIQEAVDGWDVRFLEPVTDAQYQPGITTDGD